MLQVISGQLKSAKKSQTYEFSSVQYNFPDNIAKRIKAWGRKNIPQSEIYTEPKSCGREDEIHVTIKYGLHTTDVEEIKEAVEGFGPFTIRLGKISRFTPKGKDFDVVKAEVTGHKLRRLHHILGNLKNSDEHPRYKPHVTIAYVKTGSAYELSGNDDLKGTVVKVEEIYFSNADGRSSTIKL